MGEAARAGSPRLRGFGMSDDEKVLVEYVDGSTSWAVPREKHPAVFSPEIRRALALELSSREWPGSLVLDPFAGRGFVHELPKLDEAQGRKMRTVGVEIEPEWAACSAFGATLVGDATKLPAKWRSRFGAVVTSPCYGNRFADSHTPKDKCSRCAGSGYELEPIPGEIRCSKCKGSKLSPRRSYTHDLGHALSEGSAGAMHYGPAYRDLHRAAWGEVERVLKPGGLFLLNMKDHVRDKKRVRVTEWHRRAILKLGFVQLPTKSIRLRGMQFGANREARVPTEVVLVFRKPEVER